MAKLYNFDTYIDRTNTASYKWDQSAALFGHEDIIPMWVADMDFPAPQEVIEKIKSRAEHGVYGYTIRTQSYYDAIINWQLRRHQWKIQQEWISSSPGVVPALSILVQILSEPGDRVIVQSPVYYPFFDVIRMNDRQVINNALLIEDGKFVMNFSELEAQMAEGAKLMLLCNPHNPGGRVWSKAELEQLGQLALKYNVVIVSDEIHGDLIFQNHRHIPLASINNDIAMNTVTCIAPSKTFNLAGLQASNVIIANPKLRRLYNERLKTLSLHMESYFGGVATESAYTHGEAWLDQVLAYMEENINLLMSFFEQHLPQCRVMRPEGTYLVWVDCREISEQPSVLKSIMFDKARVAFTEGSIFGDGGVGRLRINIACPRSFMLEGLERFAAAVHNHIAAQK